MRTETINTHDIRLGDVIVSNGMRLLVDQEPQQSKAHPVTDHGGACMWTAARVLNWDEVQERGDRLLVSFIRSDMAAESLRTRNGLAPYTEPRWVIQGNGLATWSREIKEV